MKLSCFLPPGTFSLLLQSLRSMLPEYAAFFREVCFSLRWRLLNVFNFSQGELARKPDSEVFFA